MKDRLKEILKNVGMNARQFAEYIDVQPSSVSHILTGRNKPSVDFLIKLLESFPDTDIRYLLTGEKNLVIREENRHYDAALSREERDNSPEELGKGHPEITSVKDDTDVEEVILLRKDGTFRNYRKEM